MSERYRIGSNGELVGLTPDECRAFGEEFVEAFSPSGKRHVIAKGDAIERGWSYRLLDAQPKTALELPTEAEVERAMKEAEASRRRGKGAYTMSKEERRKVYLQTGYMPDDYASHKRYLRENDLRDEEPGERGFEKKKLIAEWARSGAQGECPAGRHGLEVKPRERDSRLDDYIRWREANAPRDSD